MKTSHKDFWLALGELIELFAPIYIIFIGGMYIFSFVLKRVSRWLS